MAKHKPKRLLEKIRRLKPRDFENLVYDLVVRRGLGNVKWRTPGADGGRDIEGETLVSDFSGSHRSERWYVECKRQVAAVDWPTVHSKLAYAHNQRADYLLVATTSSLSPAARDEVAIWNEAHRLPVIREWGGVDLERFVDSDIVIREKYGFAVSQRARELSSIPLLTMLTKLMHQVYGESFGHGSPTPALEFAAAASEYAEMWLQRDDRPVRHASFYRDRHLYSWCDLTGRVPSKIDWEPYALRAVLSCIRFYSASDRLRVEFTSTSRVSIRMHAVNTDLNRLDLALAVLCTMADFEWSREASLLTLTRRSMP